MIDELLFSAATIALGAGLWYCSNVGKVRRYNDELVNVVADGKGRIKITGLLDSFVYDGDLVDGEPHGKGKETYPNGDVFECNFFNGKAHG